MPAAALLALALAAQPGDPCVVTDARGRAMVVCFDPGNRVELSAGASAGTAEPVRGGALELGGAVRWRSDTRGRGGEAEWLRDQTFVEARVLAVSGEDGPRAAQGLLWRGTFIRHRASPFLLVPAPRPLRLPFPFDVGLRVEVGEARWDASAPDDVGLVPLRSAFLLDLGSHGGVLRRLAFGPEVAWGLRIHGRRETVQELVPFSAGVLDLRAESADGLWVGAVLARGGSSIAVPGGAAPFVEASALLERVVVAVNDRPVALYLEAGWRGGGDERVGWGSGGIRIGLPR